MSASHRVQAWREAKRQDGLKAVTIWLTTEEELRLKDLALQQHCAPSAIVQQALATFQPTSHQGIGNVPDTELIREMIRAELTAMQEAPATVADTVTDNVTVTGAEIASEAAPAAAAPDGGYGTFRAQLRAFAMGRTSFTCRQAAKALQVTAAKAANNLKALVDQGQVRKKGAGHQAVYRWVGERSEA